MHPGYQQSLSQQQGATPVPSLTTTWSMSPSQGLPTPGATQQEQTFQAKIVQEQAIPAAIPQLGSFQTSPIYHHITPGRQGFEHGGTESDTVLLTSQDVKREWEEEPETYTQADKKTENSGRFPVRGNAVLSHPVTQLGDRQAQGSQQPDDMILECTNQSIARHEQRITELLSELSRTAHITTDQEESTGLSEIFSSILEARSKLKDMKQIKGILENNRRQGNQTGIPSDSSGRVAEKESTSSRGTGYWRRRQPVHSVSSTGDGRSATLRASIKPDPTETTSPRSRQTLSPRSQVAAHLATSLSDRTRSSGLLRAVKSEPDAQHIDAESPLRKHSQVVPQKRSHGDAKDCPIDLT